jgi:hypothetical protein
LLSSRINKFNIAAGLLPRSPDAFCVSSGFV